ncbi:hypothetical protein PCASD_17830 [Puccinia coronata f. sp. avenae]|uniref:Uncharacterized protein n=1 Tax=Puccinia coronata f. sp. avenae TaxID=200324 RepID=A0A2N5S3I4_9BASI|nr:hypothetical protein PCASD_24374 [Puccinia coronata f. sp. avenae]PLW32249.1 hypothetical protein PCASD_17830 [Puccinia coronata f. sp. avenae]
MVSQRGCRKRHFDATLHDRFLTVLQNRQETVELTDHNHLAKTQHHHHGLNHHQGLKRLCAAYNPARRAHQTPSRASDEQLFYQGQLGASGSMTRSVQLTHNGDCVNWTLWVLEPEASD